MNNTVVKSIQAPMVNAAVGPPMLPRQRTSPAPSSWHTACAHGMPGHRCGAQRRAEGNGQRARGALCNLLDDPAGYSYMPHIVPQSQRRTPQAVSARIAQTDIGHAYTRLNRPPFTRRHVAHARISKGQLQCTDLPWDTSLYLRPYSPRHSFS